MDDKPPFDTTKWAFILVAFILFCYVAVPVAGAIACLVYSRDIILNPEIVCDPKDRLAGLLAGALAAALALYTGMTKK